MSKSKKSFILYSGWGEIFYSLTDKEAGQLIKAIFDYQQDVKPKLPTGLSRLFISIRQTLDRDTAKWESIRERNIANGIKGGRPKKTQNNPKNPDGFSGNPKNLVSVSVNDNVINNNTSPVSKEWMEQAKIENPDIPDLERRIT